jgi:D-alanyl-D-alanine carboxypeptidase
LKSLMLKATRQPKSTKALAAPVHPVLTSSSTVARLVLLLALLAQLACGLAVFSPSTAHAELAPPQVAAPAAIAVDVASGRILYGKNIHKQMPMASTTKIMTVLTAFSIPGTSLSETYKVVKDDLVGEASIPLSEGEVITFQDLLWGTLMNSGNDGANAIARYAGSKIAGAGDPVAKFVARMNTYAAQLGMRNSHYANPHGLDQDGHYSSAFDLAISGWYLLKNPTLKKIVGTQTATVAGHALNNLNNPYLKANPGANGIKPGYTDNAGLVLVGSATRDNTTVITVVMDEQTEGYRSDPTNLLNYSFAQLKDPTYLQTIQQGASAATAADYIGRPEGDKLFVFNTGDNGVINAQVNQAGTPGPTASSGGSGAGGDDSNSKKSGVNIFTILLIILILLGLVYVVLRFTPLGGDRGRQIAYSLEDAAAKTLYGLRKFWTYLKPGSNDDEPATPKPPKTTPALNSAPDLRSRLSQANPGKGAPTRNPPGALGENQRVFGSGEVHKLDLDNQEPAGSFGRAESEAALDYDMNNQDDLDSSGFEAGDAPQPPRPLSTRPGSEPLVRPISDLPPFKSSTSSQRTQPIIKPLNPSQPTRPTPTGGVTNNPGSPGLDTPGGFGAVSGSPSGPGMGSGSNSGGNTGFGADAPGGFGGGTDSSSGFGAIPGRDPNQPGRSASGNPPGGFQGQPISGSNRAGSGAGESSFGRGIGSNFGQPEAGQPGSGDSLAAHARQAIDYAYAGRFAASIEEFKRVVEQNPLFDFASVEEFEQMPVLGYKALATAYRETGKPKFAVLLLDMAVENFPNELELRNMLKHMRRDVE